MEKEKEHEMEMMMEKEKEHEMEMVMEKEHVLETVVEKGYVLEKVMEFELRVMEQRGRGKRGRERTLVRMTC